LQVNGGVQSFVIPLSQASVSGVFYQAVFLCIPATLACKDDIDRIGFVGAYQCDHLVPILASVVAMTCLGEAVHWYHAFGFIFVLAGSVIANHRGGTTIKTSSGLFKKLKNAIFARKSFKKLR